MTPLLYAVDLMIIGAYFGVSAHWWPMRWFDWANVLGGPLLVILTIATVGWTPVLLLTVAFTIGGAIGLVNQREATA